MDALTCLIQDVCLQQHDDGHTTHLNEFVAMISKLFPSATVVELHLRSIVGSTLEIELTRKAIPETILPFGSPDFVALDQNTNSVLLSTFPMSYVDRHR
jgi:hypothetical protein